MAIRCRKMSECQKHRTKVRSIYRLGSFLMNEVLEIFLFICLPKHDFQSITDHHKNLILSSSQFRKVKMSLFWWIKKWMLEDLISWRNHKNRFYRSRAGDLLNFKGTCTLEINFTNIKFSTKPWSMMKSRQCDLIFWIWIKNKVCLNVCTKHLQELYWI